MPGVCAPVVPADGKKGEKDFGIGTAAPLIFRVAGLEDIRPPVDAWQRSNCRGARYVAARDAICHESSFAGYVNRHNLRTHTRGFCSVTSRSVIIVTQ